MARKDTIMMTHEELRKLHVINKALEKSIMQVEAAEIIGLSTRQVRRIIKRVKEEGDRGIIHRSRGRDSNRAMGIEVKEKALKLYKKKYDDFGPTLGSEKLFEIDKIKINDETLRLWLIEAGIEYKKRKKREHRQMRERKECNGEMLQMDGSDHDWFEGRGEKCVFIGCIDDATSTPFGRFYPYEGTLPAMDCFKGYIKKNGIPINLYMDKHTTYKSTKKQTIEEELNNTEALSQFGRAVKELGVNIIYADSPQAKGRVERLFGTFQNRVIKEMRLQGIKTIEEGNKFLKYYLPIYSKKFAVKAANDTNLHRPIPKGINLDKILCIKTLRRLRNDWTIVHDGKLYQIQDNVRTKYVIVEERINGAMFITYKDSNLRFKEITKRAKKEQEELKLKIINTAKKVYIPPKDHPWRKFKLSGSFNLEEREEVLANAI